MSDNEKKGDWIKVTGLWKKKDKDGNTLLVGGPQYSCTYWVAKNKYKKEEGKEPDYFLYVAASPKKDEEKKNDADL